MGTKIKISDIARQSGVSVATVSLALNYKPGVSPETRAHVLAVASELGYPVTPPAAAQPDRRNRLATVGMLVKTEPDLSPQANPFYSKIMLGIEEVCRRSGINLMFATLPVDEENCPVETPQMLYNEAVDGLLMVGAFVDETITSISAGKQPAPIVLVDGYSNTESFDAVISDNFRAAYQAVEYLIQKGHRHIGLIGSDPACYPSLLERRNGYLRALKENKIAETYLSNFNLSKTHGYNETLELLRQHPQLTALFCVNDEVAAEALRAALTLGKRVPADLSIIGYDDTYFSAGSQPALTTLHVDTLAMGRAAVHLLALRVEHPTSARMTFTVHSHLVERDSVRALE